MLADTQNAWLDGCDAELCLRQSSDVYCSKIGESDCQTGMKSIKLTNSVQLMSLRHWIFASLRSRRDNNQQVRHHTSQ